MLSTPGDLPFFNAYILFSISSIVGGLVSMSVLNNSLFGTSTGSSGASEFRTSEKCSLRLLLLHLCS